ncbi:MAG TPA: sigma-54 dependent transcriptional regulator [bacterium]|nr:sigma-54 dependent transcriptional regulator [bacterium]
MKQTILVVDDEQAIRASLKDLLQDEGYRVETVDSGEACVALLQGEAWQAIDAVLLDIWLPGMDGIAVLKAIKQAGSAPPVIMLSGHANIETAVIATKLGAYHFVEKPFAADNLLVTLSHALRENQLERENQQLKLNARQSDHEMVGRSPAFLRLLEQVERAASSQAWVLIYGENGTGKESIAHLIHQKSPRKDGPFVEVNCAAIPEELIESELFGHEKGAFTGATARKIGKFDQANQGTLFLDEIGDMSLKTQAKILRVLQEQRFERVGGNKTIEVDVRVIAASNKKLEAEIAAGNFREDLYYRLNVLPLTVPPLRERSGDVRLLVPHFLEFFSATAGDKPKRIHPDALALLEQYDWPGNIRELKNIVERLIIMAPGQEIVPADLPPTLQQPAAARNGIAVPGAAPSVMEFGHNYKEAKDAFERAYLKAQLEKHNWNISKTAEGIKLERSNLHKKIRQYGLEVG